MIKSNFDKECIFFAWWKPPPSENLKRFRALKSVAATPGSQSGFRFQKVATHFPTFGLSFKVNAGNNIPYMDAMGTEYNNEFN